jgi:UDP-N-acetylmuramoylalanine--D-glutamate ligase
MHRSACQTTPPSPPTVDVVELRGRRVLVVGLGRFGGGVRATRWLASQGAEVTVTDLATAAELSDSVRALDGLDVRLRLGGHDPADLHDADLAVINPAVDKRTSPLFQEIVRRAIPWTTEINLFCAWCPAPVVGVTGTYGKSTTASMLREAVHRAIETGGTTFTGVHLGGNIGRSLLTDLPAIRATDLVILELSSAQLEDISQFRFVPRVAVITTLAPQHLDRHGTWDAYVRAKLQLVEGPDNRCPLVLGDVPPDVEQLVAEIVVDTHRRVVRVPPADPPLHLGVIGTHNYRNADCVLTVTRLLGIEEAPVREALTAFAGLPHRLEHVATIGGVAFVNDSKATTPTATMTALEALSASARTIVAIVGGCEKGVDFAPCAAVLRARCRAVVCTGASGPRFAAVLLAAATEGATPVAGEPATSSAGAARVITAETLPAAVREARALAQPGDTVLFAPGAPSFDHYANFEDRGAAFRDAVRKPGAIPELP